MAYGAGELAGLPLLSDERLARAERREPQPSWLGGSGRGSGFSGACGTASCASVVPPARLLSQRLLRNDFKVSRVIPGPVLTRLYKPSSTTVRA